MTWRKREIMEMAREAGVVPYVFASVDEECLFRLKAFAELVREDEAEKHKWDIHSCGPTCERYACVAMREAVLAEREACAMVCDELPAPPYVSRNDATVWDVATLECGDSIRARGQA